MVDSLSFWALLAMLYIFKDNLQIANSRILIIREHQYFRYMVGTALVIHFYLGYLLMKIFSKYLMVKRSFLISIFIFIIFAILDTAFNFISELENLSIDYTFFYALKHALTSMPHRSIEFLEGACLLGLYGSSWNLSPRGEP